MTPRSIRRAAERKAKKAASKAERMLLPEVAAAPASEDAALSHSRVFTESLCRSDEPDEPEFDPAAEPTLFEPSSISAAQLAANRSNAQLSSGPTSADGKASSSLNAVKTGLTGRTVLLPSDQAADYERHVLAWQQDLRPQGARECDLVQSIADTTWRLRRIPGLESAIFAQGHIEFAESFQQHHPSLRGGMIEVQTFMKYEKQLRNLQLQESRLVRRREKELAELHQLQQERSAQEREALETASDRYLTAKEDNQAFEPIVNGFVFTIEQIEQHLEAKRRQSPRSHPSRTAKQAA